MPTGGVSPTKENLSGWFDAGAICVGMGSKLISKDILQKGNFDTLEKNTRAVLELIQQLKNS